jgi:TctA family transporter
MDLFTIGFPIAFSLDNLIYCFLGVFLGTAVGVLPGIGPLAAIAMLLPITFHLDPVAALILLSGIYYGTEYGGSTASILLNVPGTAANAVTALDSYPMAQQGRAGIALLMTSVTSFIGDAIGIVTLIMLSPLIIQIALSFGPTDYFALMMLGLLATAGIGSSEPIKGLASVLIGLLIGTIGVDVNTGIARYNFGFFELFEGISIVVLAIGLFGVTEIIASVTRSHKAYHGKVSFRSMIPTGDDMRRSVAPTLRGAGIGSFFGALPGAGPMLAAFFSYLVEKRISKSPERFGKSVIEGVAAPEAANNAAAQTAFIPMLTMGIPGSTTMAVILGAMMIHGITPGPLMIQEHPDVFWGLIASFWIGNVLLLVLNIPLVGLWVCILQVPYHLLYPVIVVLICLGVYSVNNSVFDIGRSAPFRRSIPPSRYMPGTA